MKLEWRVNKWAADETKGQIQELLPVDSVDEYTRLVLANALYFKGTWQKEFDSSKTEEGTFNLLNAETVQVPMMATAKKQFIKRVGDCQILHLPYVEGQDKWSFSMCFLLPDKKKWPA
jgi:serpin B